MSGLCFFASDLHGSDERYRKLFVLAAEERPRVIFLGGDLLPHHWAARMAGRDFIGEVLAPGFDALRRDLGEDSPQVFLILGNDDDRASEPLFLEGEAAGLWSYAHERWGVVGSYPVLGYAYVPPTPFQLKDWERYDVSRFVDPGCVSPEEGWRSVPVPPDEARWRTIAADLDALVPEGSLERAVFLFHAPPYRSALDRAALDGRSVEHAPLDVHVGSIAVRRFIEARQPLLTLHGHVHESARLTGSWRERIGRTWCLSAAHDGPELALVRFDPERPEDATREHVGV